MGSNYCIKMVFGDVAGYFYDHRGYQPDVTFDHEWMQAFLSLQMHCMPAETGFYG